VPDPKVLVFHGNPERLDRFLARALKPLSRTRIQRLIAAGQVVVNGRPAPARALLAPGNRVQVTLPDPFGALPASSPEIRVLFEDEHVLAVDKPAGLVVHPAGPHEQGTLVQKIWPKLAGQWRGTRGPGKTLSVRPGIVHRLDSGTSGVMVIAKTPEAADHLSRQFAGRTVKKIYWAWVRGIPSTESGRICSVVGRSQAEPHRMSVHGHGRWSETSFRVLKRFPADGASGSSLLEVSPHTGRTHQIRVQLAALGHPVLGDAVYGSSAEDASRPLLHALSLELTHPATGRMLRLRAPLPDDFEARLRQRKRKPGA
jgi:23S rRNA pseudouridine1911/1915/1917 synthase